MTQDDEPLIDKTVPWDFPQRVLELPEGFSTGVFEGRRYSTVVRVSDNGDRIWLFARELADQDIVSFNLYRTKTGVTHLRPCEMSSQKVIAFVAGYRPDAPPDRADDQGD